MTRTTTIGKSDIVVNKVAHGLMMMTWSPKPPPEQQCFDAIKAGIDSLPSGVKMFLNAGAFYGPNYSTANVEMLSRFFEKYPEYADRTFLSVKGGNRPYQPIQDGSPENVNASVNLVLEKLRGTKRLDLFECARVDPNVPVEVTIGALAQLRSEGKLDHIGMSECSAATLRRGNKVTPISVVEIEISPFSYEQQTRDVIDTAKELGITVLAYSPLGRGFFTGQIKKPEDIPEGDIRRTMPRFYPENFNHNLAIVESMTAIAQKKGIASSQLSIAWVSSLGPHVIPLPGSSHPTRTLENLGGGGVEFTEEELKEVNEVIATADIKGTRYPANHNKYLWA